jgi:hypothetical protein
MSGILLQLAFADVQISSKVNSVPDTNHLDQYIFKSRKCNGAFGQRLYMREINSLLTIESGKFEMRAYRGKRSGAHFTQGNCGPSQIRMMFDRMQQDAKNLQEMKDSYRRQEDNDVFRTVPCAKPRKSSCFGAKSMKIFPKICMTGSKNLGM